MYNAVASRSTSPSSARREQRERRAARAHHAIALSLVNAAELQRRRELYRLAEETCDDAAVIAEFAFPLTQDARRTPDLAESGVSRFSLVTRAEFDLLLSLASQGTTPWVAAAQACGIMPGTFRGWIRRGLMPGDPDARYAAFAIAVKHACSVARAAAERIVYEENPLAWLRMGPGGATLADAEGWTEQSVTKLTGPDGVSPPEVIHRVREERMARIAVLLEKTELLVNGDAADDGEAKPQ